MDKGMREIKYRKWIGEYYYCILQSDKFEQPCAFFGENKIHITSLDFFWNLKANPEQVTESKDINGNEIWEGDICKCFIANYDNKDHTYIGVVSKLTNTFIYRIPSKYRRNMYDEIQTIHMTNDEVIGNIHKNIDLIK